MNTQIGPENVEDSLKIASGYAQSAQILMKSVGQTRNREIIHSMVVLRGLALNIYLRSLYALDRGKAWEGHHVKQIVKQIFDALRKKTRREVAEDYDRSVTSSEFIQQTHAKHQEIKGTTAILDLEHVLQDWSDALVDWRHFFSPQYKVAFLAFEELEKAFLHRIKELSESRISSEVEPRQAA